jgi:ribosome-associated protein
MIRITPAITLDERELDFEFVRAAGPGGQNVNKVATAVQLRFDAKRSPSLPEDVRARLLKLAGSRATSEGVIVIHARRFRSQHQNRQDSVDRLVDLIRQAARRPRRRIKTRPTAASRRKRLDEKRRRGRVKHMRTKPGADD